MADWGKVNTGTGAPAQAPTAAPAPSGGGKWARVAGAAAPAVRNSTDMTGKVLPAAAGVGLLAGGAAAASKFPGRIGKVAGTLNAIRSQAMLSGLAPLKSLLGNLGAASVASIERGTTRPLRELLSKQTLDDAVQAYRKGSPVSNEASQVTLRNPLTGKELPTPGRFMGAADEATQKALMRAGLSANEAAREVLQTPLAGPIAEALDNPLMRYLIPFRRTPINQLLEGGKAIGRGFEGDKAARRALTVYGTAGAAHGAATSDDSTPVSVPLAIAASGRYGLPYGLAALAGRFMAGGKGGGQIAGNVLPVSEYGVEQGITDPLRPFGFDEEGFGVENLAPIRALERLTK